MSETPRIVAIIPAAGWSRRMGRPKQLIDVGGRPMLWRLAETMAAVEGIADVMIVTRCAIIDALGASNDELSNGKIRVVFNEDESSEMIDSIRVGLRACREREDIAPRDGILVCPGDYPGLTTAVFAACVGAYRADVSRVSGAGSAKASANDRGSIIIASHGGRRGHPIILPAELIPFVMSPACDGGLNALTREFADRVQLVELPTDAVLRDADEPGDLPTNE